MEAPRPVPVSPPSWRQLPPGPALSSGYTARTGDSVPKSGEQGRLPSVTEFGEIADGVKYDQIGIEKSQTSRPAMSLSTLTTSLSSPSNVYAGPPPPYTSTANPTASSVASPFSAQTSYRSPPESRRDSGEGRGSGSTASTVSITATTTTAGVGGGGAAASLSELSSRQALPSISEALARLPGSPRQHQAREHSGSGTGSYPPKQVYQGEQLPSPYSSEPSRTRSETFHSPAVPGSNSPPPLGQNSFDARAPAQRVLPPVGHNGSPSLSQHRLSMSSHTISPVEPPSSQRMSPRPAQASYTSVPQGHYYTSTQPSPQQTSNAPLSAHSLTDSFPPSHPTQTRGSYAIQSVQSQPQPVGQHPSGQQSYAYSFPPPQTSGLSYEQSLQQASLAQQQQQQQQQQHRHWPPNPEFEKVEEKRRAAAVSHAEHGTTGGNYAVTVKRHLDDFDVENNLNDLAERTGRIMEFSRQYGVKAHQYPRSGIPVAELPKIDDCDRMIEESICLRTALERLRKVVEQQNQLAEQNAVQQGAAGKPGVAGYPSYTSQNSSTGNGTSASDKGLDKSESAAGGFAGGDSKKRRGRNAPPGRCHSCNRVETPEWRRGPDGARTLCNACGLHYAKLTRKLAGKDKPAAEANTTET